MKCDQCDEEIVGTPAAFPLGAMQYEERLRFCNFHCLEAYAYDNSDDEDDDAPTCPLCGLTREHAHAM